MQENIRIWLAAGDRGRAIDPAAKLGLQAENLKADGKPIGRGGGGDALWRPRKGQDVLACASHRAQVPLQMRKRAGLITGGKSRRQGAAEGSLDGSHGVHKPL